MLLDKKEGKEINHKILRNNKRNKCLNQIE